MENSTTLEIVNADGDTVYQSEIFSMLAAVMAHGALCHMNLAECSVIVKTGEGAQHLAARPEWIAAYQAQVENLSDNMPSGIHLAMQQIETGGES